MQDSKPFWAAALHSTMPCDHRHHRNSRRDAPAALSLQTTQATKILSFLGTMLKERCHLAPWDHKTKRKAVAASLAFSSPVIYRILKNL